MAESYLIEHLEVRNADITIRFTCPNYGRRIDECVANLMVDDEKPETTVRKQAFYGQASKDVTFRKGVSFEDKDSDWRSESEIADWDAFFFENTDYPLHVIPNVDGVRLKHLVIGKEMSQLVAAEDAIIFGSVNYRNQVGRTDIKVIYEKGGEEKNLSFTTEVLSYKMDYRTDMRNVIRDIEEEFAMLSYSFLKETYLTFHTSNRESTDLIWWQIFRDCFKNITEASRLIIGNPKRRLQTKVRYERADRLTYMPPDLENEYEEFKDNPAHLYRTEEMFLSKDTVENRFLKYALTNISDRFKKVQKNVLNVLKADNVYVRDQIREMNEELTALVNDPFFRGIGTFMGFTQESLVMKQAAGYRDVYDNWITLQCGYDLQEGVMHLEVKEISELYEIWCFIKVKNMVQHILRNKASLKVRGSETTGDFVKALVQGSKSEVVFLENEKPDIQLASVMYNATTDDEEQMTDESAAENKNTDIADTTSKTTEQRPDIVLRLSKTDDRIQYTYLFDAKYRIRDTSIPRRGGVDVPPVDAINQMHRYRDAIYYTQSGDEKLKREVIGGYVLYPGNLNKEQFLGSYYQRSIDEVNIGAFPLKPGGQWKGMYDENGNVKDVLLDINSSEDVLYRQIETWINDDDAKRTLINNSIPQRGLTYHVVPQEGENLALIGYVKKEDRERVIANKLYYTRAEFEPGSLRLRQGFEWTKYLLLHDAKNADRKLYLLSDKGPRVVSKEALKKKGFDPSHGDIFLVFDIEDVEHPIDIDASVILPNVKQSFDPYSIPFAELMKHPSEDD